VILDDRSATRIELRILGYQFTDSTDRSYDGNWLVLELQLETPTDSWTRSAPRALTWEMERLALWLRELADGKKQMDRVDFMEPEIAFRYEDESAGGVILFVRLAYAFRPDCAGPGDDLYFQPTELRFTPSPAELGAAAASIESELRRFPERVG
jgi:hypothetical protein